MMMHNLKDDIVRKVKLISDFVGDSNVRQTQYKLEKGILPGYKEGRIWCLRKSTYLRQIELAERGE